MREIIVDSFAGGGGASTGIEMALGRSPDIAINHDATALAMHEVNHPDTKHLVSDVWEVDPVDATEGQPVGLAWFSPDCKHFSKAKGGKPVEKKIRGLAWVVVHWANTVAPRVIILENVEEFQTWGPLGADNKPCPVQKGATFRKWVGELQALGYVVEWRELRACDFGAPTIRKRLFLIARRDGAPIVWPEPTHGDPKSDAVKQGRLLPWRTAAEIIDWSLPCPSIFATSAEIMAEYGLRAVRPLQAATMARLAKGVWRYAVNAAEPFIVSLTHHGGERTESLNDPIATVTGAHRGEKAIVEPFIAGVGGRMGQTEPRGIDQPMQTMTAKADSVVVTPFISAAQQGGSVRAADVPLHTVTASSKDQNQVIIPTLVQTGYGERPGQDPRVPGLDKPLGTVVAGGVKHALAATFLTKFRANSIGSGIGEPAPTVTANSFIKRAGGAAPLGAVAAFLARTAHGDVGRDGKRRGQGVHSLETPHGTVLASNDHALIAAHLMTMRNSGKPFQGANQPAHTVTAGGAHQHLVAAFLAQNNYSEPGHDARTPMSTIVGKGSTQSVIAANLLRQFGTGVGSPLDEPTRTVMADGQGKTQLSAAFLQKYYGTGEGQELSEPAHTVTTKDRFGIAEALLHIPPFQREHAERARKVADLLRSHGLWDDREFVTFEVCGVTVVITDLGMRMLVPPELFLAQSFPETYVIDRRPDGSPISKTEQVSKAGNSVCPVMAKALVVANYSPRDVEPAPQFMEAAE